MRKVLYIFGQLVDADVEWLASVGVARGFKVGSEIIQHGSAARRLFIVLEGRLAVTCPRGKPLAEIGVGEVVGEMSLLEARPPSADVRALTDATLLEVSHELLTHKLDHDPPFGARFYKALALFLSDRLRAASAGEHDARDAGELDLNILDNVSQAGVRFDRLVESVHRRSLRGEPPP